jgi:serine/threonine protein kinase
MQSGRYQVGERIGGGGMAEVFRATYVGEGGIAFAAAIKRIHPHLSKDGAFVESFMHEAEIAARIKAHKNIVSVKELGRDEEGRLFLAMELVEGKSLRELTERWPALPASVSVFIVCEVLRALRHAHTLTDEIGKPQNVVHRDVSPHNILISYEGCVKLADFGIAKGLHTMSSTGNAIKGKAAYLSPEQANCEKLDARSDLFSVGIILHELLTGERLFGGPNIENESVVLDRIRKMEVKSPKDSDSNLSDALARVSLRLLEKDRNNRISSAEDALSSLLDCAESSVKSEERLREIMGERFPRRLAPPHAPVNTEDAGMRVHEREGTRGSSKRSKQVEGVEHVAPRTRSFRGGPRGDTTRTRAVILAVGVTAILVAFRYVLPDATNLSTSQPSASISHSIGFDGPRDQSKTAKPKDQLDSQGARPTNTTKAFDGDGPPLGLATRTNENARDGARNDPSKPSQSPHASESSAIEQLSLKVGDRFRARLEVGISTLVETPVISSVEEPVDREGERILRIGDLLRGRASSDGHRVYVRFDSIETKKGSRSIRAVAQHNHADGLPAQVRGANEARAIGGSADHDAHDVLRDDDSRNGVVLEVRPGLVFDVVVVESSKL